MTRQQEHQQLAVVSRGHSLRCPKAPSPSIPALCLKKSPSIALGSRNVELKTLTAARHMNLQHDRNFPILLSIYCRV